MIKDHLFTEELARDRILVLTDIHSDGFGSYDSDAIMKALLWLDRQSHDEIVMVCQGWGGKYDPAVAVHDMMQAVESDVRTVSVGLVQSAGAMVSCAGAPGKRHCFPNTRFVLHDMHKMIKGFYRDLESGMQMAKMVHDVGCRLYAEHCGRTEEEVEKLLMSHEDVHMTAQEALEWGVVDSIVRKWGEWEGLAEKQGAQGVPWRP